MRLRSMIVLVTALLTAGTTQAVPMNLTGTLQIALQGLTPVSLAGAGTVNVSPGSVSVPAGFFMLPGQVVVGISATTSVASVLATGISNLTGTFSIGGVTNQIPSEVCVTPGSGEACVTGGGLGGPLGIIGTIKVVIIPDATIPIALGPANSGLGPANIGLGGATIGPSLAIDAAPWTTGAALINTGVNVLSLTGSSSGETLRLVTTTFVEVLGNTLPITGTLTLSGIVPEPGALLLLLTGVAGLIVTLRGRSD